MELFMIRHGESESNIKISKMRDAELTTLGKQQAARAAAALRDLQIQRLYCSPQRRAMDTASILAEVLDLSITVWPDLTEIGFSGDEPGLTRAEIKLRFPRVELTDAIDDKGCLRHWGDETQAEMRERMKRAATQIRAWAAESQVERVACVTHGTSGNWLLRHLLSVDPTATVAFAQQNCCINHVTFRQDGQVVLNALNRFEHLEGLPLRTEPPQEAVS